MGGAAVTALFIDDTHLAAMTKIGNLERERVSRASNIAWEEEDIGRLQVTMKTSARWRDWLDEFAISVELTLPGVSLETLRTQI